MTSRHGLLHTGTGISTTTTHYDCMGDVRTIKHLFGRGGQVRRWYWLSNSRRAYGYLASASGRDRGARTQSANSVNSLKRTRGHNVTHLTRTMTGYSSGDGDTEVMDVNMLRVQPWFPEPGGFIIYVYKAASLLLATTCVCLPMGIQSLTARAWSRFVNINYKPAGLRKSRQQRRQDWRIHYSIQKKG